MNAEKTFFFSVTFVTFDTFEDFKLFFFLFKIHMSSVSEAIDEIKEEEIFEKPKKAKRVLTEKQKEALAKGRAKVKENKAKKTSAELKKEQREEKKVLSKRQLKALEQVKKNKTLDEWDETKSNILATMPDVDSYNLLNNYLDKLTPEDILDKKVLKHKIGSFAKHLHERAN